MKRSLRSKVRALGLLQVTLMAGVMLLLGVLFFHKMLADEERIQEGTSQVKRSEAESLAKLMALELGRVESVRRARSGLSDEDVKEVAAVLWEKVTFIGGLDELDLIARRASGGAFHCIRPMGVHQSCESIEGFKEIATQFETTDHLVFLRESRHTGSSSRIYVVPLYVGGSFWGLVRLGISNSNADNAVQKLAHDNKRGKILFVVLFVVCLAAAGTLLFVVLASFFRRMHEPLLALTRNAVAFGENPGEAVAEVVEADPEDEIGELARRFSQMQQRLHETIGTLQQAVIQKEAAFREMEEKDQLLRRSERLASMGVLAAGIAHEIGNKLNPMGFVAHNLRKRIDKGKELDPSQLDVLTQSIESCSHIIDKLRSLGRPSDDIMTPSDLNEVVHDVQMLLGAQSKSRGVSLDVDLTPNLPDVPMVRSDIVQVLINLILNGRQAVLDTNKKDGYVRLSTRVGEDGSVVLEVADNGTGMTEEVRGRLFEPFFTTKGLSTGGGVGGTGLGLYVCYGILSSHGVEPSVVTAPGKGTRFVMAFPRGDAPEEGRNERDV